MSAPKKENFIVPLTTIGIIFLLITVSFFKPKENLSSKSSSPLSIEQESDLDLIDLPFPNKDSRVSVERALNNRRSYRSFQNKPLSLTNLSQLLWSAQGVTVNWGGRTAPSFKSVYPLSVYVIPNQVTDLDPGLYKYNPGDLQPVHQLRSLYKANLQTLFLEETNQYSLQHAPLILIITGNMGKMAEKYEGQHHDTEVYLEAGHVAQNLFLQSESLGLGMAVIRNFDQDFLKETLKIPEEETIIYLIPIGFPKK